MKAEIRKTNGYPVVIAKTPNQDPNKPTYLVYGHYDVQPPDPLELWTSPPFEPRRVGRNVYACGISDNKGPHLAHINSIEAWLKTGNELPLLETRAPADGWVFPRRHLPRHPDLAALNSAILGSNPASGKIHLVSHEQVESLCLLRVYGITDFITAAGLAPH